MSTTRNGLRLSVFPILALTVILGLLLSLSACGGSSSSGGSQVKAPVSSSSAKNENYKDIEYQFEKAGFTNVKSEALGDLITGWLNKDGGVDEISIDGKTNYSTNDMFEPDAKVIIRYHSFPVRSSSSAGSSSSSTASSSSSSEASSSSSASASQSSQAQSTTASSSAAVTVNLSAEQALEQAFPVETARKAAIVALTNATASDVFASDGNSHDASKYHSYSDHSGDYLDLVRDGSWSAKDGSTWHVSDLKLVNSWGTDMTASLDVTFDGTNYVVSNLTGFIGKPGIGTPLEEYEPRHNDTWTYLTVPPELLV